MPALKLNEGRNGVSRSIIAIIRVVRLPQPDIESARRAQIKRLRAAADTQSAMKTREANPEDEETFRGELMSSWWAINVEKSVEQVDFFNH